MHISHYDHAVEVGWAMAALTTSPPGGVLANEHHYMKVITTMWPESLRAYPTSYTAYESKKGAWLIGRQK